MSLAQSAAAKQRSQRDAGECCSNCGGSGRILGGTATSRARAGGNARYLNSLQPGEMSMAEMGRKGGRPTALTLKDLAAGGPHKRRESASQAAGGQVGIPIGS